MSTNCENSYAEETVRELKNMAPAAVYAFLRFKSCDVRENCIHVESEGIAFINGYAMIKYINVGSQKLLSHTSLMEGLDDKIKYQDILNRYVDTNITTTL